MIDEIVAERGGAYGSPRANHSTTADMFEVWRERRIDAGAITSDEFDAVDTVVFNILQKLSRLAQTSHHRDSWADVSGYALNGLEITRLDALGRVLDDRDE
jgi:hypothetical protein